MQKIRLGRGAVYPACKSYYFSIKWLTPFYPANPSQAAGGGEKCMDLRFLRLRRWLLKQQPNKTVFNRFIENRYQTDKSEFAGVIDENCRSYRKQKTIS